MRLRPGATSAVGALALAAAGTIMLVSSPSASALADDEKAIVHVLNRIGFGPRPGDVERVHSIGLRQYIESAAAPGTCP